MPQPELAKESAKPASANNATTAPGAATLDMKLEVIVIPVSDINRSREFYQRLGWRLDAARPDVVQFTPPGSGCSVQFGGNRTTATPGSAQGLWLIVSDLQAVLDKLAANDIKVNEVYHIGANGKASGLDPQRNSYRSFASFQDPDGNRWLFQEVTSRLPGRLDPATTSFASVTDLAAALRRAAAAHGQHEARTGQPDPNWPDWYAEYMASEQSGQKAPL